MAAGNEGLVFRSEDLGTNLSEQERLLRDRFVQEYFVDYDALRACLRLGYDAGLAPRYAIEFMDEPYVQKKIAERRIEPAVDPKTEEAETKRRIREMLLAEASYRGPGSSHAARVSALSQLKAIYGMDAAQKIDHNITRGGVMKVPGISSIDNWEAEAERNQEKLRNVTQH